MGRGSRSGGGRSSFGGSSRSSFSSGGRGSRSAPGRSFSSHHSGPSIHIGGHGHYHHWGHRHHGHVHVYGGSASPKAVLIIFMIFFAVIFGMVGFANLSEVSYHKESIEIARQDYDFYQDMIDDAYEKRDQGYIVYGQVVTSYYDYEVGKHYLVYKLPGINKTFETFSVYSEYEALRYSAGDSIELAVDYPVLTSQTDSIDTYLKNVEFEEFSLYILANDALSSARGAVAVPFVVTFILIVGVILIIVKDKKSSSSQTSETPSASSEEPNICRYCGSIYDSGKRKCSNCGASLK